MVSFTTAFLALLASTAVSASTARTWSGTSCSSGDELSWSGHSVTCESLGKKFRLTTSQSIRIINIYP